MALLGNFCMRSRDACFNGNTSAHADYATKPSKVLNVKALSGVCDAQKCIYLISLSLHIKVKNWFSIWFLSIGFRNATAKNHFPWNNFIGGNSSSSWAHDHTNLSRDHCVCLQYLECSAGYNERSQCHNWRRKWKQTQKIMWHHTNVWTCNLNASNLDVWFEV